MTTSLNRSNGSQAGIFRASAIRNYMKGKEETVLPRFVSPRTFIFLWIFMLLLIAAVGLAWRIEYPLYETALAVTAGEDTISPEAPIRVMVLLAPETIVQCNDTVVLNTPQGRIVTSVLEVSPNISSPKDIREQINLDPGVEIMITQPARIAAVEIENLGLPSNVYAGTLFQAEIETGTQRVISLLPVIGKHFRG